MAKRLAQDCLPLPATNMDLSVVNKLANTAVTAGSHDSALPCFQAWKAMSNYRLGH